MIPPGSLGQLLLAGVPLLWVTGVAGQVNQDRAVTYTASQLHCARFIEVAESRIRTETAGRLRHQTSERHGRWRFRAAPSGPEIALEGWLDSLSLARRAAESTITPDTDGLLGGRYRGTLTPRGSYSSQVRPFVPDEVAEVAGMATALDDFFPPLPPVRLEVGQVWSDSDGLSIRRLPDSALSGVPLLRFELDRRSESRTAVRLDDTIALSRREVSEEEGAFVWHPTLGLIGRDRRIVVQTTVPVSRAVRQPVRSKVEQQITLRRDLRPDSAGCR